MAKARYMVFIPSGIPQVGMAAHHFLTYGPLATSKATVHPGNPYDTLLVFAEDTPEIDSHMKQLGVFIGELANEPEVTVTKEGPKATAVWEMRNPHYRAMTPLGQDSEQLGLLSPDHSPGSPLPGSPGAPVQSPA